MTFYIFYQIINVIMIVATFYMVMRLYDHLDKYENRALFLLLTGLVLDIIGQFSISHCDTVEAAGVGLRLSLSGRAVFGIGFILYITLVFKAKSRWIITIFWGMATLGAFSHGFMLGDEHQFLANPHIVKIMGVSTLQGDKGPLYYLEVVAALSLALWMIFLAVKILVLERDKCTRTEKRITIVFLSTILFHITVSVISGIFCKDIPVFSLAARVLGIFIFYRYAVKYTFENYDALEYKTLLGDVGAGFLVISTDYEIIYANGPAQKMIEELGADRGNNSEEILKYIISRKEYQLTRGNETYKIVANRIHSRGKLKGYSILTTDITDIVQLEKRAEESSLARKRLLSSISHELRTPLNAITQASEMIENKELDKQEIAEYADVIKNEAININDMISNFLEMSSERSMVSKLDVKDYNVCALTEAVIAMCNDRISRKNIDFSVSIAPNIPLNCKGDEERIKQVLTTILTNAIKYTDEGNVNLTISGKKISDATFEYEYLVTDVGNNVFSIGSAIEKAFTENWNDNAGITSGYEISFYVVRKLVNDLGGDISVHSLNGRGNIFRFRIWQDIINHDSLLDYNLGSKIDVICCGECTDHIVEFIDTCKEYGIYAENISGIQHLRKNPAMDTDHHILLYKFDKHEKKMNLSERAKGYTRVAVLNWGQIPANYDPDVIYVYKPLSILTLRRILLHIEEKEKTGLSYDRFTAPGARILVVDDNTINIELAIRMLEQYKMTIDTVTSGFEAIELLSTGRKYDIIFMDYMMDGLNGVDTTARVRAMSEQLATVPIIAFSANNVVGAKDMYLNGGMDDVIFKPATKSDIETVLRKFLPKDLLVFEAGNPSFEIPAEPFPQIEDVDSAEAAKYVGNNIVVYKDMLVSFARDIKGREQMILDYLASKDFNNFVIQTHAIKGIARTLGMTELSGRMARMELAGKEVDLEYINANLADLLSYYRKFTKILMPFVEEKEKAERKIVVSDKVGEVLIEMHNVLEDFEIGQAENLFHTIWPGDYDDERMALMRELKEALEIADYYESLEYVERLIATYNVNQ